MNGDRNYFYLNSDNKWPQFVFDQGQLAISHDGSLTLKQTDGAFAQAGVFCGGPFEVEDRPTAWHRLRVYSNPLPEGTHLQVFTFTSDDGEATYDSKAETPFMEPDWRPAPRDVLDILIPHSARRLWIGGLLRSDGQSTPTLHQIRIDYAHESYLEQLPAIFSGDEGQRRLLKALLSLQESILGEVEDQISDLPLLFDPDAAPTDDFPSWLNWLASWLAFDLNEVWSNEETRKYLAEAFQLYGKRGTVEGLSRYLRMYAGVGAHIFEPAQYTSLWSLGETSTLGFTTMLTPAELQGTVLDTSSTLDQSHLVQGDDLGAALFDDVAHHFCVYAYCADLDRPGALDDLRTEIEREKPAHTAYDLCLIDARKRVSVQARVGIDAIVAKGPPRAKIGMILDTGVLAGKKEEKQSEAACHNKETSPSDLGKSACEP